MVKAREDQAPRERRGLGGGGPGAARPAGGPRLESPTRLGTAQCPLTTHGLRKERRRWKENAVSIEFRVYLSQVIYGRGCGCCPALVRQLRPPGPRTRAPGAPCAPPASGAGAGGGEEGPETQAASEPAVPYANGHLTVLRPPACPSVVTGLGEADGLARPIIKGPCLLPHDPGAPQAPWELPSHQLLRHRDPRQRSPGQGLEVRCVGSLL